MHGLIYFITHRASGRVYVGKTTQSLSRRWKDHIKDSKKSHLSHLHFYRALRKYGSDSFDVEQFDTADSEVELNFKEVLYIALLDSVRNGFNMTAGGEGFAKGHKFGVGKHLSPATKAKLSAIGKSRVCKPVSAETRMRMRMARLGKKFPRAACESGQSKS